LSETSQPRSLEEVAEEIERLRVRLQDEQLDAEGATEVLEQITALAADALAEIERRAEELEERQRPT
jgi:uncharacterized coiled-coil DUF342 family protein